MNKKGNGNTWVIWGFGIIITILTGTVYGVIANEDKRVAADESIRKEINDKNSETRDRIDSVSKEIGNDLDSLNEKQNDMNIKLTRVLTILENRKNVSE